MFFLRLLVIGVLAIVFASLAMRTLRTGRFSARGGKLITRAKNPAVFWLSLTVQCSLTVALLAYLVWLIHAQA